MSVYSGPDPGGHTGVSSDGEIMSLTGGASVSDPRRSQLGSSGSRAPESTIYGLDPRLRRRVPFWDTR